MNYRNKIIILITMILSMFIFNSCAEDNKKEEAKVKTCETACESWQTCNKGNCELSEGFCENNESCKDDIDGKTECNTEHKCVAPTAKICEKGEKRCNGNNVETCSSDASEWIIESCNAPQQCDATTFTCKAPELSNCTRLSFDNITLEEHSSQYGYLTYAETLENNSYSIQIGFYNNPVENNKIYDLGKGVNTDFSTCDQCIIIYDTRGNTQKDFFQVSGSIKMEAGSIASGKSKGEVMSAKLIEVTINESTFEVTPVKDGRCIEIEANKTWAWDNISQ